MMTAAETEAALAGAERWIRYVAWRWCRTRQGVDPRDVLAEVRAGFVYAATKFDPSRGAKFETYAKHWGHEYARAYLRGELAGGLRFPVRAGFRVCRPVQEGALPDGGSVLALTPAREAEAAPEFPDDFWEVVLAGLTGREAAVIRLRFRDGLTTPAVARRLGITRQRVSQIQTRAVQRLRTRCRQTRYLKDYCAGDNPPAAADVGS